MSRPKPTEEQIKHVLLTRGSGMMTYHIRNCLEFDFRLRGVETRDVLAALKRMERRFEVYRVASNYSRQICWALKGCPS